MLVQRGPVLLNSGSTLQQEEEEAPEISRIVDNLLGKREHSVKCLAGAKKRAIDNYLLLKCFKLLMSS